MTSAPAPEGPWDPPAVIEENGIDPSLFTDGDGKRYMVLNRGARLLPLTPDARAATGPARLLWYGDIKRASEGPHILQKDGWYYIILAEGGTGMTHQISVGRARTLEELGKEFNVTRERVRQIEAKALRKLRHPSRAKRLRDYLDE